MTPADAHAHGARRRHRRRARARVAARRAAHALHVRVARRLTSDAIRETATRVLTFEAPPRRRHRRDAAARARSTRRAVHDAMRDDWRGAPRARRGGGARWRARVRRRSLLQRFLQLGARRRPRRSWRRSSASWRATTRRRRSSSTPGAAAARRRCSRRATSWRSPPASSRCACAIGALAPQPRRGGACERLVAQRGAVGARHAGCASCQRRARRRPAAAGTTTLTPARRRRRARAQRRAARRAAVRRPRRSTSAPRVACIDPLSASRRSSSTIADADTLPSALYADRARPAARRAVRAAGDAVDHRAAASSVTTLDLLSPVRQAARAATSTATCRARCACRARFADANFALPLAPDRLTMRGARADGRRQAERAGHRHARWRR
jgi:hypothetical protein